MCLCIFVNWKLYKIASLGLGAKLLQLNELMYTLLGSENHAVMFAGILATGRNTCLWNTDLTSGLARQIVITNSTIKFIPNIPVYRDAEIVGRQVVLSTVFLLYYAIYICLYWALLKGLCAHAFIRLVLLQVRSLFGLEFNSVVRLMSTRHCLVVWLKQTHGLPTLPVTHFQINSMQCLLPGITMTSKLMMRKVYQTWRRSTLRLELDSFWVLSWATVLTRL